LFNRFCAKSNGCSLEKGEESSRLVRCSFVSYPLLLGRDLVVLTPGFCFGVEEPVSGLVLGLFVGGFVG
jgi:hypothetical protein